MGSYPSATLVACHGRLPNALSRSQDCPSGPLSVARRLQSVCWALLDGIGHVFVTKGSPSYVQTVSTRSEDKDIHTLPSNGFGGQHQADRGNGPAIVADVALPLCPCSARFPRS